MTAGVGTHVPVSAGTARVRGSTVRSLLALRPRTGAAPPVGAVADVEPEQRPVPAARAVRPAPRGPTVDEQLARLEARLLDEAGADETARRRVGTELTQVRALFAGATVQRFLPILIEREMRRRLALPAAE